MKFNLFFLLTLTISILIGCNSSPKKPAGNYTQYKEEAVKLSDDLQKKIGTWAKEGVECYGLVVLTNKDNTVKYGRSVKTTIVRIASDSVKVKALEEVNLSQKAGCNKQGISPGYTWWEKQGELYVTREEADNYLKSKDWQYKASSKGKYKIGD